MTDASYFQYSYDKNEQTSWLSQDAGSQPRW